MIVLVSVSQMPPTCVGSRGERGGKAKVEKEEEEKKERKRDRKSQEEETTGQKMAEERMVTLEATAGQQEARQETKEAGCPAADPAGRKGEGGLPEM